MFKTAKQRALVLLPTYNEAENIESICRAILAVEPRIPDYSLEILVIDDNSPDGTSDIVKKLALELPAIHLINGQKAGLGKAYLRGFRYGLDQRVYDAFIMMDADFSHPPSSLPALLATLEQGNDYVIGSRYVHGGAIPGNWPLRRIINSKFANFLARTLVGIDRRITDLTGGFKAIRATAMEQIDLDNINAAGYVFQVSLLHAFLSKDFRVAESPIIFADRQFGTSKMKLRDILEFMYRAYQLNPDSSLRRMIRFALVGASGAFVNLVALTLLVNGFGVNTVLAYVMAVELSIISNFFANHLYSFKGAAVPEDSGSLLVKLGKFNVGTFGGALLSLLIFTLLHKVVGMNYILADLCAIVLSMGWNYWISTRMVWKVVDARS